MTAVIMCPGELEGRLSRRRFIGRGFAGAVFGTVEAVKTVSDLYLPVPGTITELNPKLSNAPELVNNEPYGDGWMIKMKMSAPGEVDSLLNAAEYEDFTKAEE